MFGYQVQVCVLYLLKFRQQSVLYIWKTLILQYHRKLSRWWRLEMVEKRDDMDQKEPIEYKISLMFKWTS